MDQNQIHPKDYSNTHKQKTIGNCSAFFVLKQADRQTDGRTDSQTDRQTDRQEDGRTDRQTDRQTQKPFIP